MRFINRYLDVPRPDDELSSIADNLRALFNARSGYGGLRPSYGVGIPYPNSDTLGTVRALLDDMLANVLRYEPRLSDVVLTSGERDSDLCLAIQLSGVVAGERRSFTLRYQQNYGEVTVDVARV